MFGIGETELAIILIFGFLLFGPDKLPGVGRTVGRALRQFRDAEEGFTKVVQTEVIDPMNKAANGEDADDDLDRDLDDVNTNASDATSAATPKESFAERKARMEAERKAAGSDTPAAEPQAVDADSDADLDEGSPEASAPDAQEDPEAARRSIAALYGLDDDLPDTENTDATDGEEVGSE